MPTYDVTFTGTIFDDIITPDQVSAFVGVSVWGATPGYWFNDLIYGGDGNDTINGGGGYGSDLIYGGNGNDVIESGDYATLYGDSGSDVITGGAEVYGGGGNDTINAESGYNSIYGGDGNDVVSVWRDNYRSDYADGGAGSDTVINLGYGDQSAIFVVNLTDGSYGTSTSRVLNKLVNFENIIGTTVRDILTGDGGANAINGQSGDDTIYGGAGNDALTGGDGNDVIYAGTGSDNVNAGNGSDTVFVGEGVAVANGGAGIDTLNTSLWSGDYSVNLATGLTNWAGESYLGFENLVSGAGNDTLTGTAVGNAISGGIGNDQIYGQAGGDALNGEAGNDSLYGGADADVLSGGDNDDVLDGGAGNDTIFGGSGNDLVIAGQDSADGGAGMDTLDGSAVTVNWAVDLGTGVTNQVGERYTGFEVFLSGTGSDSLTGSAASETIYGGNGNDAISTGGGDDVLYGGEGFDILSKVGAGNVALYGGEGGGTFTVIGSGAVTIVGGSGQDYINLTATSALNWMTIDGGSGLNPSGGQNVDVVKLFAGAVTLDSVTRFSRIEALDMTGTSIVGTSGNDNLDFGGRFLSIVTSGGVSIDGGEGNDVIGNVAGSRDGTPLGGKDTLLGGGGNDTIFGGSDDDLLIGGSGFDVLAGGEGNDTLDGSDPFNALFGDGGDDLVRLTLSSLTYIPSPGSMGPVSDGGAGIDTLDVSASGRAFVNLNTGQTGASFLVVGGGGSVPILGSQVVAGFENVLGGNGADSLIGDSQANLIMGGEGNDTLDGLGGTDTIQAGGGNDLVIAGNDSSDGGTGTDTLDASGVTADWTLDLATGATNLAGASFTGFEVVLSGSGNDTLFGGAPSETLFGGLGNDALHGGAGSNALHGGEGNDRLFSTGTGADSLFGGADDDYLDLNARLSVVGMTIDGGAGQDIADLIEGTVTVDNVSRFVGVEALDVLFTTIRGTAGANDLDFSNFATLAFGSALGVRIDGSGGNDRVGGSDIVAANDTLLGGGGNDTLDGGLGNDTLNGGVGQDTFVFASALGTTNRDRIVGFSVADDTISLDDAVFTGLSVGQLEDAAFRANLTGRAEDATDRIIYETDSGRVYFDADGTGAGARILFATLDANLGLSFADFVVS